MTDVFVLDASIALAFLFREPVAEGAVRLLNHGEALVPGIWEPEVVNGMLVATRRGRFSPEAIQSALVDFAGLLVTVDRERLNPEALFALAQEHHLTAYDATYLELALRRGAPIATLDATLQQAARRAGVPLVV